MTEKVIAAIKRGEVVILPLEHSYVYACDAFSFAAVNRLHQLRNDPPGIAAQVVQQITVMRHHNPRHGNRRQPLL